MIIYMSHSREFDFKKELYVPIRESPLNSEHDFILPHENSNEPFDSENLFAKGCDLVISEVSFPSTGQGIELAIAAREYKLPLAYISKKGSKTSGSLAKLNPLAQLEYSDAPEVISVIEEIIEKCKTILSSQS